MALFRARSASEGFLVVERLGATGGSAKYVFSGLLSFAPYAAIFRGLFICLVVRRFRSFLQFS